MVGESDGKECVGLSLSSLLGKVQENGNLEDHKRNGKMWVWILGK
jgi:hypothetical protein